MARARKYWLMKSEPGTYSIDDLARDGTTMWEGVRNYQARNLMRDDIKKGDLVLFYHSSTKPMGVAGIAKVCRESYPDPTQFNKKSKYYDATSPKDEPRWPVGRRGAGRKAPRGCDVGGHQDRPRSSRA